MHLAVERAARGTLPDWAVASECRVRHMERVTALLGSWADALSLSDEDRVRWTSLGYLHDALRDEDPELLRRELGAEWEGLPGPILHGPAAARRLADDGLQDDDLLRAIAYHTLGHPELEEVGIALYLADFLDPGRDFLNEWRADLRGRMPGDLDGVAVEVVGARLGHLVSQKAPLRPETVRFWNVLVETGGA